ncbi:MAG TPA: DUF4142 domain-containing protein [Devosiaceae bacterium]|jgi:putative membrane protein
MKISAVLLALVALSASPVLAQNADPLLPPVITSDLTNITSPPDFAQVAAISGMFEVEASKLALDKASAKDVKAFAQQMIDDHTKAADEMDTAADSQGGVTVPDAIDDEHQRMLDQLKDASGASFDQLYTRMQIEIHQDAVALFDNYSKNGDAGALKDFAGKTLPTLQQHLEMAQKLASGTTVK